MLGGLYGIHGLDDYGVEGTSVQRYTIATPGGQKVRLNDAEASIRFENKAGSFVELSPQRCASIPWRIWRSTRPVAKL